MAIGEVFIGAFLTVLFEKLASDDLITLARYAGICSQLEKLKNNLTLIRAVLVDAGEKHITETSVEIWLNKLQHLAYEIDDVLDDLATEVIRRQMNKKLYVTTSTSTSKVLKFIPTKFHALKYGRKMGSKLDEITTKLHHLVEEKNLLGLNDNLERSNRANRRSEETSLVDESRIIGRKGDKEALLGKLLDKESCIQNINVMSIVGLGGIGKTTLAQLVYNHEDVKNHFELLSWVCVSDEFDIFTISKAIFKDVGGDDRKFETLNQLQVALTEKLSKKRFLLILDDVWNEDYNKWELIQRPFTVVASGSKILVTTRKTMVASMMDSVTTYPLELLSNEEALSLFAQHALGKQNFDSHPTIKLHGEGIVKKCGGVPLALRTLGRVLRTKLNDEEWEKLLNSELWNSHDGSKIFPALRLSYYDLPSHLKHMFVYCCLFPKDYMFDKDELVLLWMGEGLLYQTNDKRSMESFGRECFEGLVSRSFFQHSTKDKSRYTMHDLINDLAKSVAGDVFLTLDEKMDVHWNESLEKFHHLSIIREHYGAYRKFMALKKLKRLQTFLAMPVARLDVWQNFFLSNKVLINLLPQLQLLRVLSLANYNITAVPQSIGSLKHMRYLNFSNTKITCLPEQVGNLHNLQSLLVSSCLVLSSLPNSIIKLINLRHLDISNTPKLNKMPLGMSGLTSLQTLSKVIIGGASDFRICDLKGLLHLQGQLSIEGLHKVKYALHAKEANLQEKKGIYDLRMEWSDTFDGSQNEIIDYEVLEGLRPFEKLASLKIMYYMGTKFPIWVGDPLYVFLTQLTLSGCRRCACLPTLGHLPSLQKLFLESMNELKRVGSEFLRPNNSCSGIAFPSLEVLGLKNMQGLEEWSTICARKVGTFPCLRDISIINCPKLDILVIESIPSLQVLHVEQCSVVLLRSMVCVSSSILRLTLENIKGLTQLHGEVLKYLRAVEHFNILECDELTYLWESEVEACEILVSLQKLVVRGCENLVSLGEKEVHLKASMECIKEVEIEGCPRLEIYNCSNSIEKLEMYHCSSIRSLSFPTMCNLPSTLIKLHILACDNLQISWLLKNHLSSLESLGIARMKNLRWFPEGCLVHLTTLKIHGCDNIEYIPDKGYGFLPFLCLRNLEISNCKNIKSFPHHHLGSLKSLEELSLYGCPSMNYSFPCGLWPPNLSRLRLGGLKKPISEWGLQNSPTSLVQLSLENLGAISFAKEDDTSYNIDAISSSFLLPSSLTYLSIIGFMELESLSKGTQHLSFLEHLFISLCPKLRDLPETLLPSLSSLWLSSSPILRKKCRIKKGKYWPIISQIPDLQLD